MLRSSRAIFFAVVLLLDLKHAVFANQPVESLSTEEIRSLQTRLSQHKGFQVDFSQSRTSSLRPGKSSKSSGQAIFGRPSKFHWRVVTPQSDIKIFDGETLFVIDEPKKTATKFVTGENIAEIRGIIDVVLNFDAMLGRYDLRSSEKQGDEILLVLVPKSENGLSKVEVAVKEQKAMIHKLTIFFKEGNKTELTFSNHQFKAPDAKLFSVPAGYKVIDALK